MRRDQQEGCVTSGYKFCQVPPELSPQLVGTCTSVSHIRTVTVKLGDSEVVVCNYSQPHAPRPASVSPIVLLPYAVSIQCLLFPSFTRQMCLLWLGKPWVVLPQNSQNYKMFKTAKAKGRPFHPIYFADRESEAERRKATLSCPLCRCLWLSLFSLHVSLCTNCMFNLAVSQACSARAKCTCAGDYWLDTFAQSN